MNDWQRGESVPAHLARTLVDPGSRLIVSGERKLAAEFPPEVFARPVFEAVEPVVREAVFRLLVRDRAAGQVAHVGHWWRRDHSVEIDIVAGDKVPVADSIIAVGSITWRDDAPFTDTDTDALARSREQLPGGDTALLIGCSRTGFADQVGLDRAWHAEDLLQAWPG